MTLEPNRVGPYLRALRAGLNALAPNDDYVPLAEALAHVEALDPSLSGDTLLPAEVDARSGLPAFAWMHRAISEQSLARSSGGTTLYGEFELEKARSMDPALYARLQARQRLHRHLRSSAVLPTSYMEGALRRRSVTHLDFALLYDRLTPDGLWTRIRIEVSCLKRRTGPILMEGERVIVDDGVPHLLARHGGINLMVLRGQLQEVLTGEILRLSRCRVGPFWFPGSEMPDGLPEAVRRGLTLHLSAEVVAQDVRETLNADPLRPPPRGERAPEGQHIYRERRFACGARQIEPLRAWAHARGCKVVITPM